MALTINVSKVSVSKQMEKLWSITFNLKCNDAVEEVLNRNFSVYYRQGQNFVEDKIVEMQNKMQKAIDDYKKEQQIFTNQQLDDAVVTIQDNLIG